jgi:hypothetical protein
MKFHLLNKLPQAICGHNKKPAAPGSKRPRITNARDQDRGEVAGRGRMSTSHVAVLPQKRRRPGYFCLVNSCVSAVRIRGAGERVMRHLAQLPADRLIMANAKVDRLTAT